MKMLDDVFGTDAEQQEGRKKLGLVVGGPMAREAFEKKFVGKSAAEGAVDPTCEVQDADGGWVELSEGKELPTPW